MNKKGCYLRALGCILPVVVCLALVIAVAGVQPALAQQKVEPLP